MNSSSATKPHGGACDIRRFASGYPGRDRSYRQGTRETLGIERRLEDPRIAHQFRHPHRRCRLARRRHGDHLHHRCEARLPRDFDFLKPRRVRVVGEGLDQRALPSDGKRRAPTLLGADHLPPRRRECARVAEHCFFPPRFRSAPLPLVAGRSARTPRRHALGLGGPPDLRQRQVDQSDASVFHGPPPHGGAKRHRPVRSELDPPPAMALRPRESLRPRRRVS